MTRSRLLQLAVGVEAGLALLAGALGGWLGVDVWPGWPAAPRVVLLGILAALPPLAGLAVVLRARRGPLARLRAATDEIFGLLFARAAPIDLAVVSLAAGLGEEILFRGFLQGWLAGVLGLGPAVALAAVAFGLAHYVSHTYAAYTFVMGLYLGLLVPATGTLWVPILAHAVYDFAALLIVQRRHEAALRS